MMLIEKMQLAKVSRSAHQLGRLAASAAAVMIVCVAAAHGSDASPGAGDLKKVIVGISTQDLNIGYPYATLPAEMGWWEEEGLDVEVVSTQSSTQTIQSLAAGSIDVAIFVTDPAVTARADFGVPIRNIYPLAINDYKFAVRIDSDIEEVADLAGKTVGHVSMGAGTVKFAHSYYADAGLVLDRDVREMAVGYGSAAANALTNGTVDALVGFAGMWPVLRNAGYEFNLLPMAPWQSNMYAFSFFSTDDYIEKNPDVIAGIGRATSKTLIFLGQNPEAGVELFWKGNPDRAPGSGMDREKAFNDDLNVLNAALESLGALDNPPTYAWGSQDPEKWEFQLQYLLDNGLVANDIDYMELFTDEFRSEYVNFDVDTIVEQARNWEGTSE